MKSFTTRSFARRKERREPITMVTAYDATFARLSEQAGVDSLLVGDSLGNVIQAQKTTLPVTLEEIAYHTRCVTRATSRVHVVADMPFGTYGSSMHDAIDNAAHLMKCGGAHGVKLEGGRQLAELIHRMTSIGIPVMGHLGFTPQSVHAFGGHYVQGRDESAAERMLEDAHVLAEAGVYAIVLEMVPVEIAKRITDEVSAPTIGIGAGNVTDGQVLVGYDLLGLNDGFKPRFLKRFAELGEATRGALSTYVDEVKARSYPAEEHTFRTEE